MKKTLLIIVAIIICAGISAIYLFGKKEGFVIKKDSLIQVNSPKDCKKVAFGLAKACPFLWGMELEFTNAQHPISFVPNQDFTSCFWVKRDEVTLRMSYVRVSVFDSLERARYEFDNATSLEHSGEIPTSKDYYIVQEQQHGFRQRVGDFYQEETEQQGYGGRDVILKNIDLKKLKNNLNIFNFQSSPSDGKAFCDQAKMENLIKNF